MTRKVLLALVIGAAIGAAGYTWRPRTERAVYVSNFENVMGTSLEIRVQSRSADGARQAEQAAVAEISRLSQILSGYDAGSEFSRWLRSSGQPVAVSPELAEVLAAFDEWRDRTGGALDPSVEAVSAVWRDAARRGREPQAVELQQALARMQQRHWLVDRSSSTAMHLSQAPLLLNSFTKSYVLDHAARRAQQVPGVTGVLLNGGGDVIVRGDWSQAVAVADPANHADNLAAAAPLARLAVRDRAVATSGGYNRGFDIAGRHYSHVIDPRTGQPTGHVSSATVVSPDAIRSGALATAFCVLTPAQSVALARTLPDVDYALILDDGRRVESAGWRTLTGEAPAVRPVTGPFETLYAAEQAGSNGFGQLTISLELARAAGMTRRPYVAVWIEDKDRFPVRTVALWYDGKSRYLPELRAWYRSDRLRAMAEGSQIVDAVTSATRTAGKYTLQWDGKDNAGKPVRPGTYTVCIEASREHGTYQVIRQDLDFSGPPRQLALPGGSEISAASLDYEPVRR